MSEITARGWGIPQLPQAFFGEVYRLGSDLALAPVAAGAGVEARAQVEGLVRPTAQNPLTMTEDGKVGGRGGFDPKIIVQGDYRSSGLGNIPKGTPIYFVVDDKAAWLLSDDGWWTHSIPFEPAVSTHLVLVVV